MNTDEPVYCPKCNGITNQNDVDKWFKCDCASNPSTDAGKCTCDPKRLGSLTNCPVHGLSATTPPAEIGTLKPCPFCGAANPNLTKDHEADQWFIECGECVACMGNTGQLNGFSNSHDCKLAWNTRTPAQSQPEGARDAGAVAPKPAQATGESLSAEISGYLIAGGLFNPEMMDHDKVRDLLMRIRSFLDTL